MGVTPKTTFIASQNPVTSPRMEVSPGEQEKLRGAIFVWVHLCVGPPSTETIIFCGLYCSTGGLEDVITNNCLADLILRDGQLLNLYANYSFSISLSCHINRRQVQCVVFCSALLCLFDSFQVRCLRDGGNGSRATIWGDHSSWLAWKRLSIPPRRAGGSDEEKVRSGQLYTHNPDAVNQYKMDRRISANSL